jgi:hypothetical protein
MKVVTSCSLIDLNRRFGGICCLHLQGGKNKQSMVNGSRYYTKYFLTLLTHFQWIRSRDSSVGIATGYRPDGLDSIPGIGKSFFPLHSIQTGSGAHPVSNPIGTGGCFAGGKAAWAWHNTHLHPVSTSRMVGLYLHSPICVQGIVRN